MSTMNVSLSREMRDFVEEELASGEYASASDVVQAGLRKLQEERKEEAAKLEILRSEIAVAMAEAERGEFSTKSVMDIAAEVLDELKN
jgi:antitoxin ParD1/3/4